MCSECPPNVHLRVLNPQMDNAGWPAHFLTEMQRMKGGSGYMGVSSFGFGGANAHGMASGKCIASSWAQTSAEDYICAIDLFNELGVCILRTLRETAAPREE